MDIYTKITPLNILSGEFEDSEGRKVKYYRVQYLDKTIKVAGDKEYECQDLVEIGVKEDCLEAVEANIGKPTICKLRAMTTRPKTGFPSIKYTIIGVVDKV